MLSFSNMFKKQTKQKIPSNQIKKEISNVVCGLNLKGKI